MSKNLKNLMSSLNLLADCSDKVSSYKMRDIATHFFNLVITELSAPAIGNGELNASEIEAGIYDGKIAAIKMHRMRCGLGLKESKDIVENFFQVNNLKFK